MDRKDVQEERRKEQMKVWKKGLAVLLAAAMCVGTVPGNVFARNVWAAAEDEASAQGMQKEEADPDVSAEAAEPDRENQAKAAEQGGSAEAAESGQNMQADAAESGAAAEAAEPDQDMQAEAAEPDQGMQSNAAESGAAAGAAAEPGASASGQEPDPGIPAADGTSAGDGAAAQAQPQASDAAGSPIEESFITLTEGQVLHQTTGDKEYYIFAPAESGWYHLGIESQKTGDCFTAGVYQTLYYEGETQEKKTYRDDLYKIVNASESDYAMWLNASEKYVFHCSITQYTDSADMDVMLTMKKADITGIEVLKAPSQSSDFAFVGTGMQVEFHYTDGTSFINDVACSVTSYGDGTGASTNMLESLRWSGIAVQKSESISSSLSVLAVDGQEIQDFSGLSEGSHTAALGVLRSVSEGQSSYLECSTDFEVSHNTIESIKVIQYTDTYTQNMAQYLGNITIRAVHKDGKTEDINSWSAYIYQSLPFVEEEAPDMPGMEYAIMNIDSYLAGGGSLGETTVTVKYLGVETSYQITILEYPYNEMTVSPQKTVYYTNAGYQDTQNGHSYEGDRIVKNDLHQLSFARKDGAQPGHYYSSNNNFPDLPYQYRLTYGIQWNGQSYTDIDSFISAGGTPGTYQVNVSYMDFQTSYQIEIRKNPYVRMEISQMPDKLNYDYADRTLSLRGLEIRAYKNDTEYDTYTYGQDAPQGAAVTAWQQYFRCYPTVDEHRLSVGDNTVYLTFLNLRAEFHVQVEQYIPPETTVYTKMELLKKPSRTLYYVRENENLEDCLSAAGLEFELTDQKGEVTKYRYKDYSGQDGFSSWENISSEIHFEWGRIDWSAPGNYVVSVYCQEVYIEFEVTVADSPVSSFEILRMPETDTYYFYENKTMSSRNLLYGLAYKITFDDGSVHAMTFRYNYGDNAFEVSYQGRTYTINRSWLRSTSSGTASAGENAVLFTLFGKQYQTDPITIIENPIESLQVVKEPEKMLYFGENEEADLYGARLRLTYQGGRTKDIEVTGHQPSVLVEEDQKYITAQITGKWEADETGGAGYQRKYLEITYLNEKAEIEVNLNLEELDAVELGENGQAAGRLEEDQPYEVFSFTPKEAKAYSFFCVENSYNGSNYSTYNFYVELYDGVNNLFTGYVGGWSGPMYSVQSLTPGHTYYYIVSKKSGEERASIPFECYISSEILYEHQLGEPEVEITDTDKKIWYEYELTMAAAMPGFGGAALKLTYPNGWTEQKKVSDSVYSLTIGGKYYTVGWKYLDPQSGWMPEIRDDNALVYTCGQEVIKEIPVQLNAPNPIASLTIDTNPFEGCYQYQLAYGNPIGMSVTVHFKDADRADETIVWDGSNMQAVDGCLLMFDGITRTGQAGENGGRIYRLSVTCMDVSEQVLFEVMPDPVTGFELIERPASCTQYPFEDSGDLDLYGMEYAIVYRDGTKQNFRVAEHGNSLSAPEGSEDELNTWYTSENRENENGETVAVTVLNLEYRGYQQKLVEFEHLAFPTEQAEELSDARTNYMVLGEAGRYRIYRFTATESSEYTLNIRGNINFTISRYDGNGEETVQARITGQNSYAGSMLWDMAAGDTAYFVIKSREYPYIGSLRAEISGETIEKEDISELEFHVENPVAGEPFPTAEQSVMDEYQIASSQWYGDDDADGCADFATAHRLMLILAPNPRYQFTGETKITVNGSEVENKILGADGRLTIYYTFPYTDCKIELPQVEGYALDTDWNSKADRVSYGGTYRFRYLDAEGMPDETLSVKANGNVVALDGDDYYTLTEVTENITVTVRKDIGDIVVGEDESKVTMHDRSEAVFDVMVGKKEKTIRDNAEGENTLPLLPSYVDGSEDFFYGWYQDKDGEFNGKGTRFTSMTVLEEDAYDLFAKWGSGIFFQRVGNRNAVYQVLSFDEYNRMTVEIKGIRRYEIRTASTGRVYAASAEVSKGNSDAMGMDASESGMDASESGVDAVGIDEDGRLEIPALIAQEQMQMQEGLDLDIADCTVVAIAENAFAGETGLTSVVLPETVESIGASAFENCTDLEEINLQKGVTKIGDRAFAGCTSLKEIVLPDTITEFGQGIFDGCDGINVVLPDTIGPVDPAAFEGADDVTVICSSVLKESGALEDLQKTGINIQTRDLAFACENGEKTFSYGGREERLVVNILINGELAEEAEEPPMLWQYTDTDAYEFRTEGNGLYVTPKRRTTDEEEISVTVTDTQTNAKTMLTLHTAAADLAEIDAEGDPVYTVEVTGNLVYTGEELYPAVAVYREEARLDASDYETVYTDNINAGTGQVTVTGTGNYMGSITKPFTIGKAAQAVIAFDIEKTTNDLVFPLQATASGGGKLNYSSSDLTIASVDDHGIVILRGIGTAQINIWASETANYQASTVRTITLTVKQAGIVEPKPDDPSENPDQNQTNPNQPSGNDPNGPSGGESSTGLRVTKTAYTKALGSKPFSLGVTSDTAIRYTSSKPKVASVNASGRVTLLKCGKTVITATAGDAKATITIYVVPKKAAAKAASKKSGELTVSWTRQKEASGYMVEYSTNKGFQKNVSKKVVKNNKTTSVTLKNLKKGKKYYVQVKAYTTIDKKKVYGTASKTVSKTVMK